MIKSYIGAIKNYVNFSGRARRKDYWLFALVHGIIGGVLGALAAAFAESDAVTLISSITSLYNLFILLPSLALTFRRLHDTGTSGWFILWNLVPIVGQIIYIIRVGFKEGDFGDNQYGPDPKR